MDENIRGVTYRRSIIEFDMPDLSASARNLFKQKMDDIQSEPSCSTSHTTDESLPRLDANSSGHQRMKVKREQHNLRPTDAVDGGTCAKEGAQKAPMGVGGLTYSWEMLNVYGTKSGGCFKRRKEKEFHILKDVSGLCRAGGLLAIMGASGAGKTTLLNTLTFRARGLRVTGGVYVNGRPADARTLAAVAAYVQQEDLFTGVFSVREQLNFNAQLRIGRGVSEKERKRRVEDMIKELGLRKCADTLIGVPGRIKGISGGEKKRLAFACELITNPMMLLCDEPTSGLDSFMAQNVVNAMKAMVRSGKTVISTIHQPSSEVFAMFDTLLILAEGRVAFLGDVDDAHKFFTRLGKPCPDNFNMGDHVVYSLAVRAGQEDESRDYVNSVCDSFRDNEGRILQEIIHTTCQDPLQGDPLALVKLPKSPYRASWCNQFFAMTRRNAIEIIRDPLVTIVKLVTSMFFSIMFGLVYFDVDSTTQRGIQDISGALFMFITTMTFSNMYPVIAVFSGVTPLFLREHWNGLYRTDVYFISRNLVELPIYVLMPILWVCMNYYMVGLRPEVGYFFTHMYVMILVSHTAVSYGYMISCLAKDYNTAIVLSTPLLFPMFLFAGLYVQTNTIPVYLAWISYLSWFKYGYECLSIVQWAGQVVCNSTDPTLPCQELGDEVLNMLHMDPSVFYVNVGSMIALLVGFRFIAFLLLLLKTYRH